MAFDPNAIEGQNPLALMSGFSPAQYQGSLSNELIKALQEKNGSFQNMEQAVDYGMKPVNGMVYKGAMAPGVGVNPMTGQPPDPNAAQAGSWEFIGNYDNGNRNPEHGPSQQGQWRYKEAQQPPAPMAQPQQEAAPEQRFPEGDIYTDWDYFQKKARADVEGMNRMPFVFSDYANVSLDPNKSMQQFYPAAWQEGGVQKTIGPNGQNIAPYLNSDFGDPQFLDTTKQDMPSLVKMLLGSGRVDERQSQALLELMKPKKLDTSFANQGMVK